MCQIQYLVLNAVRTNNCPTKPQKGSEMGGLTDGKSRTGWPGCGAKVKRQTTAPQGEDPGGVRGR